jgi:hypothetical protein
VLLIVELRTGCSSNRLLGGAPTTLNGVERNVRFGAVRVPPDQGAFSGCQASPFKPVGIERAIHRVLRCVLGEFRPRADNQSHTVAWSTIVVLKSVAKIREHGFRGFSV